MPNENSPIAHWITALGQAALRFRRANMTRKAATCDDMKAKLIRYNSWASDRQRSYAEALVIESDRIALTITQFDADIHRNVDEPGIVVGYDFASNQPNIVSADLGVAAVNEASRSWAQGRVDQMSPSQLPTVSAAAMTRINSLFNVARMAGLQRPKIFVSVAGTKIILKPERNLNNGIYILDHNKTYQGRITTEGEFIPHRRCTPAIVAAVQQFGDDPIRIARAHGHATGHCCFCSRALTDGRSVAMGYGPICAGNYGLPWGEERVTAEAVIGPDSPLADPVAHLEVRRDSVRLGAASILVQQERARRLAASNTLLAATSLRVNPESGQRILRRAGVNRTQVIANSRGQTFPAPTLPGVPIDQVSDTFRAVAPPPQSRIPLSLQYDDEDSQFSRS